MVTSGVGKAMVTSGVGTRLWLQVMWGLGYIVFFTLQ